MLHTDVGLNAYMMSYMLLMSPIMHVPEVYCAVYNNNCVTVSESKIQLTQVWIEHTVNCFAMHIASYTW